MADLSQERLFVANSVRTKEMGIRFGVIFVDQVKEETVVVACHHNIAQDEKS